MTRLSAYALPLFVTALTVSVFCLMIGPACGAAVWRYW